MTENGICCAHLVNEWGVRKEHENDLNILNLNSLEKHVISVLESQNQVHEQK